MNKKKSRNTRFRLTAFIMILLLILTAAGCSKSEERTKDNDLTLDELTHDTIKIEEKEIKMTDDKNGTVDIVVQMPDFKQILTECQHTNNMEEFIKDKLKKGDYDVIKHELTAQVTVDNKKQIVHSDEAAKQLLETELINAINAVSEEE